MLSRNRKEIYRVCTSLQNIPALHFLRLEHNGVHISSEICTFPRLVMGQNPYTVMHAVENFSARASTVLKIVPLQIP